MTNEYLNITTNNTRFSVGFDDAGLILSLDCFFLVLSEWIFFCYEQNFEKIRVFLVKEDTHKLNLVWIFLKRRVEMR